jgi:hypothetical protein
MTQHTGKYMTKNEAYANMNIIDGNYAVDAPVHQ